MIGGTSRYGGFERNSACKAPCNVELIVVYSDLCDLQQFWQIGPFHPCYACCACTCAERAHLCFERLGTPLPRACCVHIHSAAHAASCIAQKLSQGVASRAASSTEREQLKGLTWPSWTFQRSQSSFVFSSLTCLWCCNHLMIDIRGMMISAAQLFRKICWQNPRMHNWVWNWGGVREGEREALPMELRVFGAGMWERTHTPHPLQGNKSSDVGRDIVKCNRRFTARSWQIFTGLNLRCRLL